MGYRPAVLEFFRCSTTNICLRFNLKNLNWKDWLTAGMSFIIWPAVLFISKYKWHLFYLFLKNVILS